MLLRNKLLQYNLTQKQLHKYSLLNRKYRKLFTKIQYIKNVCSTFSIMYSATHF